MSQLTTNIDTLVITVGTRQIGWRSSDGIIHCFGTDSDRSDPPHINELYQELGVTRQCHQPGDNNSQWRVRDLGERYYHFCQETGDFSPVELMMDEQILRDCVKKGLKLLILWATNQPESTSWRYRRDDTLWLAKLMAGKIEFLKQKHQWNDLQVAIVDPEIDASAGNREAIRQAFASEILPLITNRFAQTSLDDDFVLGIENTGCVPSIADSLAISTAALIRQFLVYNFAPIQPNPLYHGDISDRRTAAKSCEYKVLEVSDYFWPLERLRVLSAWERGDFNEAKLWLIPHQHRYEGLLYELASRLAVCSNGEVYKFVRNKTQGIESWLDAATGSNLVDEKQLNSWKSLLKRIQKELQFIDGEWIGSGWICESNFSIYLLLKRGNYTNAFSLFAQTIERLLYVKSKEDNWLNKGYIIIHESKIQYKDKYQPTFQDLIDAWFKSQQKYPQKKLFPIFDNIRLIRNGIVHKAEPIKLEEIESIWAKNEVIKLEKLDNSKPEESIFKVMQETITIIYPKGKTTLFESLYQWGMDLMRNGE